jgi:alpha-N-arabinofuranosidase
VEYRPELAWIGTESNEFGTDEFMKWCEVVGTEPYLCLNFGTGTLDEGKNLLSYLNFELCSHTIALGWLEYCNSNRNSYYANLRRKNGREKPYNVSYLTEIQHVQCSHAFLTHCLRHSSPHRAIRHTT